MERETENEREREIVREGERVYVCETVKQAIEGAFRLQELMCHLRGAGTIRQFSTTGTPPVGPLPGPFWGAK